MITKNDDQFRAMRWVSTSIMYGCDLWSKHNWFGNDFNKHGGGGNGGSRM